jgi:DNA-binding CsgD family transcriptional regulator
MHHPYPTFPFVSSNCQQLFGYAPDEMKRMNMYDLLQWVHPEDQMGLRGGFQFMDHFINKHSYYTPQEYRFVFRYRIQSKAKTYMNISDEKISFQNRKGKYIYFSLLKNSDQPFVHVQVDVLKFHPIGFQKIQEYIARSSQRAITPREPEILQLIKKGLNNKQIAETLFISTHTVRNHRHRLFEKCRAKNVVDLLNHAASTQWI